MKNKSIEFDIKYVFLFLFLVFIITGYVFLILNVNNKQHYDCPNNTVFSHYDKYSGAIYCDATKNFNIEDYIVNKTKINESAGE